MSNVADYALEFLEQLMSDISEDHYAAWWMGGLEFELWRIAQGGDRRYGMGEVSEENVAKLRQYAADAGGWFDGDRLVPKAEWAETYIAWLRESLARENESMDWWRAQVGTKETTGGLHALEDVARMQRYFDQLRVDLKAAEASSSGDV